MSDQRERRDAVIGGLAAALTGEGEQDVVRWNGNPYSHLYQAVLAADWERGHAIGTGLLQRAEEPLRLST